MAEAGGPGKAQPFAASRATHRYERSRPGELIHIDVKKPGRFGVAGKRAAGNRSSSRGYGWECCHACVHDATRLAYVEVLPNERGETATAFLRRAVAWLTERGVKVERVMTDNGSPYVSAVPAAIRRELGIRHLRTRPYRPQNNGKAERFIQTMLRDGPMGASTAAQPNAARRSPAGSIATTTIESTAPSVIARQLLVSTSCWGTTWLGTTASP